jgi:hypothetical protein
MSQEKNKKRKDLEETSEKNNQQRGQKNVKLLMKDNESYLREVGGLTFDTRHGFFLTNTIEVLRAQPLRSVKMNPGQSVFTYIDPDGGGSSATGIVTLFFVDGILHIGGIDSGTTNTKQELLDVVGTYFALLRQRFPHCRHHFYVEYNYGGSLMTEQIAIVAKAAFQRGEDVDTSTASEVYVKYRGGRRKEEKFGVVTTRRAKAEGIKDLANIIEAGQFFVAEGFVTRHPKGRDEIKNMLFNQLLSYRRVERKENFCLTSSRGETPYYTGKSIGIQDEVATALILCFHEARTFDIRNEKMITENLTPSLFVSSLKSFLTSKISKL